jgi:hypothetical protein
VDAEELLVHDGGKRQSTEGLYARSGVEAGLGPKAITHVHDGVVDTLAVLVLALELCAAGQMHLLDLAHPGALKVK